jgi:hypothetical protein
VALRLFDVRIFILEKYLVSPPRIPSLDFSVELVDRLAMITVKSLVLVLIAIARLIVR